MTYTFNAIDFVGLYNKIHSKECEKIHIDIKSPQ